MSLVVASKIGNLNKVIELINLGANVHADDDAPLRYASRNGHLEVVKYLLSMGADVHAYDDAPLCWASINGHLEVVKYLVSVGADVHADDDMSLRWASRNGHLEVVKYLLSMGADIHAYDDGPLCWASENGHLEVVKYLQFWINKEKINEYPEHTPFDINLDEQLNKIATDIPIGTFFTGTIQGRTFTGLFVRSYDNIVLLNNPKSTWDCKDYVVIEDYEEVKVEIVNNKIIIN
jgi:hypothetical protein